MRLFKNKSKASSSSPTKPTREIDLFSKADDTAEETTVWSDERVSVASSRSTNPSQRSSSKQSSSSTLSYIEEILEIPQQKNNLTTPIIILQDQQSSNNNKVILQSHADILQQANWQSSSASQKVVHDTHQAALQASSPSLQRVSSHQKKQSALKKLLCFDTSCHKKKKSLLPIPAEKELMIEEYVEEEARQDDELIEEYGSMADMIRQGSYYMSRQHNDDSSPNGSSIISMPPSPPQQEQARSVVSSGLTTNTNGSADNGSSQQKSVVVEVSLGSSDDKSMISSSDNNNNKPPLSPKSYASCTSSVSKPPIHNNKSSRFVTVGNNKLMAVQTADPSAKDAMDAVIDLAAGEEMSTSCAMARSRSTNGSKGSNNGSNNKKKNNNKKNPTARSASPAVKKVEMPTRTNTLIRDNKSGKMVATKTAEGKPTRKFLRTTHKKHDSVFDFEDAVVLPNLIDAQTEAPILPVVLQKEEEEDSVEVMSTQEESSTRSTAEMLQDLVIRPTWTIDGTSSSFQEMENQVKAAFGMQQPEMKEQDREVPTANDPTDTKTVATTESTLLQTCQDISKSVFGNFFLLPQIAAGEAKEETKVEVAAPSVSRSLQPIKDTPKEKVEVTCLPPEPSLVRKALATSAPLNGNLSQEASSTKAAKTMPNDVNVTLAPTISNVSSMTKSTTGSAKSTSNRTSILKRKSSKTKNEEKSKVSRAGVKFAAFDLPSRAATSSRAQIAWQRCKPRQARNKRRAVKKGIIKKHCRENVKLASIAESDHENDEDSPKPTTKAVIPVGFELFPSMNVCQGSQQPDSDEDVATVGTTGEDSVTLAGLNQVLYRTSSPVPRFPTFQSALFSNPSNSFESLEEDDDDAIKMKRLEKLKREHYSETSSWMYYLFAKDAEPEDDNVTVNDNDSVISQQNTFDGTLSKSGSEDDLEVVDADGTVRANLWNFRGEPIKMNDSVESALDDEEKSMDSNVDGSKEDHTTMPIKLFQKSHDESSIVGVPAEQVTKIPSEPVRMSLAL